MTSRGFCHQLGHFTAVSEAHSDSLCSIGSCVSVLVPGERDNIPEHNRRKAQHSLLPVTGTPFQQLLLPADLSACQSRDQLWGGTRNQAYLDRRNEWW